MLWEPRFKRRMTLIQNEMTTDCPNSQRERVLVVDDEPAIRRIINRWVTGMGYHCTEACDGVEALNALQSGDFVLLISDISMPRLDGMALLEHVRAGDPLLAVIMVTAVDDREVAVSALQHGAYGYLIKPFNQNELVINVTNALERRRLVCQSLDYERTLEETVRLRTAEIRHREEQITLYLMVASEHRDEETGSHIRRMARYAAALAAASGWPDDEVELLRLAAPMHDIGKIGIPDQILLKVGKLTPDEFDVMKQHTVIGATILAGSDIPLIQMACEVALCHHERWDGTGYPHGLSGEEIPEAARIVALADVYDALTTDRIYRPAFSEDEALSMITDSKGQFDPRLLACFCANIEAFREIRLSII